jgi:hypothetical protein
MAGELIIPNGITVSGSANLGGELNLTPSFPTASVAEGTTVNALSIPAYQIDYDYDLLEGTFDTVQTGSLNIQGSVNFNSSTGVRIYPTSSGAPSFNGTDGQFVFSSLSGNYYMYVWLNGGWRRATLTT